MVVKIELRGTQKLLRTLQRLPRELNKQVSDGSGVFMKRVQKSAKLRAPRMTGELAQSIRVRRLRNGWTLIVGSPYGIYQEEGFRPHWVHAGTKTKNKLVSIGNAYNIAGFMFVSKFTPFVTPALEMNLSNLGTIMAQKAKKAINNASR